jgi:hypothetical protein
MTKARRLRGSVEPGLRTRQNHRDSRQALIFQRVQSFLIQTCGIALNDFEVSPVPRLSFQLSQTIFLFSILPKVVRSHADIGELQALSAAQLD